MSDSEFDDTDAKHQAPRRWVAAVNPWGRLGQWDFLPAPPKEENSGRAAFPHPATKNRCFCGQSLRALNCRTPPEHSHATFSPKASILAPWK
jgi:hypothetical protein